jgi:hypothetical protein
VSPSGRFLALLESPRSLLVVELAPGDEEDTRNGLGSVACTLGTRAVIPADSELTGFGWMQSADADVLADCGTGGLRVWEVALSQGSGLRVLSLGGVDATRAGGGTPAPRALCWHPAGKWVVCVTTPKGLRFWGRASTPSAEPGSAAWLCLEERACAFGFSKLAGSLAWGCMEIEQDGGGSTGGSLAREHSVLYITGQGGVHVMVWDERGEGGGEQRMQLCGQRVVDVSGRSDVARGVVALAHCGLAAVTLDGTLMMRAPPVGPPLLKPIDTAGGEGGGDGGSSGAGPTDVLATLLGGGLGGAAQVGGLKMPGGGGPLISVISADTFSDGGAHEEPEPRAGGGGAFVGGGSHSALGMPPSPSCSSSGGRKGKSATNASAARARVVLLRARVGRRGGAGRDVGGADEAEHDLRGREVLVEIVGMREIEGVVVPDVLSLGPVAAPDPRSRTEPPSQRRPMGMRAGGGREGEGQSGGGACLIVGASAQASFSLLRVEGVGVRDMRQKEAGCGEEEGEEEEVTLREVASIVLMAAAGVDGVGEGMGA